MTIPAHRRCAFGCASTPPVAMVLLKFKTSDYSNIYPLCQYHVDRLKDGSWTTVEALDIQEVEWKSNDVASTQA